MAVAKGNGDGAVEEVHILWVSEGMSCDGDTVSMTAAGQPSIEDVVLGLIPGSGLASAEDMERTESDDNGRASAPRAAGRLSARQRDYLVQAAVTALAVDERAATAALESLAQENLGHGLASLNADEARRLLEVVRTRAQAA